MSEESKPDEPRLPDELAAFEAALAARALAVPRIDRDQLMYRAGWAACEAQWQPRPLAGGRFEARPQPATMEASPPAEPGAARERRLAVTWSLGSAALAASIAVMATLGWQEATSRSVKTKDVEGGTPQLTADEVTTTVAVDEELARGETAPSLLNNLDHFIDADTHGRQTILAGPWLAMQRLDLRQVDARDDHVANDAEAPPTPKTIRDLQHELLPNAPAPPDLVWPWQRTTSGDSI